MEHENRGTHRAEVFMCRDPHVPKFVPAEGMSVKARRALAGYCDAAGLVKNRTAAGIEELVVVKGELDLPQEYELVLQLAVQGLDIPRPLDSVRALVEQCRVTWE